MLLNPCITIPTDDEVYFCGNCRRSQEPFEGVSCRQCGKLTVSWFIEQESEADAMEKWRHIAHL